MKYGKGEILPTPWRKWANPMLTERSRLTPPVTLCGRKCLLIGGDERAPYLCGAPSKPPEPQPNYEENIRQIEGHGMKYLTTTLQHCRGHEEQGKCGELSQSRGDEGCLVAKCSVVP